MAITLKKNSLSGDTAMNPTIPADESTAATAAGPEMSQAEIAMMAMGHRGMVQEQRGGSYTWAAVIGLICVLMLVALILIQVVEDSYYKGAIPVRPYVPSASAR